MEGSIGSLGGNVVRTGGEAVILLIFNSVQCFSLLHE